MSRLCFAPRLKPGPAIALFVVGLLMLGAQGSGQTAASSRVVQRSSLPAIDRGVVVGDGRTPGGVQARALRTLASDARTMDRVGAGRGRYLPGRVIVRFRGTPTAAAKARAVREASRSGSLSARPSNVDFDEVRIDAGEDAEAVARTLGRRADIEYAQVAYRVEPRLVPNDPLYAQLQWNFPQVDLERGWDIQRGADSSLIVAVLDTGMAYQDAIVQFRALLLHPRRRGLSGAGTGRYSVCSGD